MPPKILAIDDNLNILQIYRSMLEDEFDLIADYDVQTAMEHLKTEKPKLVLVDIEMQKFNGFNVLRAIRELDKEVKFLVISGRADINSIKDVKNIEISKVLVKPFHINKLRSAIKEVI